MNTRGMRCALCALGSVGYALAWQPTAAAQATPSETSPAPAAPAPEASSAPAPSDAPVQAAPSASEPNSEPASSAAPQPPAADAFASFSDGLGGGPADPSGVLLKVYGDTLFQLRNREPVNNTFAAAHLDLFVTADLDRLSFLSEVFFEADGNEMAVDIERVQVSYLVNNWLRLRAGRTHTAYGYYNDTYHHGNLFELTTSRPYTAQFEDNGGLLVAHLVGVGLDGTIETGIGALRYDLEAGNGRLADTTAVAVFSADKNQKLVNLRLRLVLDNGFTFGVNGVLDKVPVLRDDSGGVERPSLQERIAGVHLLYMENNVHALVEGSLINHESADGKAANTLSVFGELGYAIGYVTPYARLEWIRFPNGGDVLYQSDPFYANTRTLTDLRVGVNYRPLPALALKLEGERLARAGIDQELLTIKAAFGF